MGISLARPKIIEGAGGEVAKISLLHSRGSETHQPMPRPGSPQPTTIKSVLVSASTEAAMVSIEAGFLDLHEGTQAV